MADLRVVVHRDTAGVARLVHEWQELLDTAGATNPFTGPDWAFTWYEHFARGRNRPHLLEVREGERLAGVVPLYLRRAAGGARHLRLAGTGQPWIGPYEVPCVAADPRLGRDVARAVVAHLCGEPSTWDWAMLSLGSAASWLEPEWLPDTSYTVLVRRVPASVVLDLTRDVDVLAGRRNLKESFRRARNRLTRDAGPDGWAVRRVTDTQELPASLERLVELHARRAGLRSGAPVHVDVFGDPAVAAFLRDVVGRLSERKSVSVYELVVNDEVVASQLVLHTTTASYSSVSGMTEGAWPYSAVTYLQFQALRDAQQAGHTEMSLSLGPNQAKLRWTDNVVVHPEFALVGPRRRSQALYLGVSTLSALAEYRAARHAHRASR